MGCKGKNYKKYQVYDTINFGYLVGIFIAAISITLSAFTALSDVFNTDEITSNNEILPAYIDQGGGEVLEVNDIPVVEEVDGGQFEDVDTGVSVTDSDYEDLGAAIETFDTSTPQAFAQATLNKCIIARNKYGAQCVSYARSFWFSYANRDVSTCGTGMAKGMMNCADVNAGNDFVVIWKDDLADIQAGDWLVFNGGTYGHIGMALGPVVNGYVVLQGENQGGASCGKGVGGSAVNRINKSVKDFIGGYRPTAYIKQPEPDPTPEPTPSDTKVITYTYVKGDYFSKVLINLHLDENNLWGEDGTVEYYTNQLINQDMLDSNGNVKIGKLFTLTVR